MTDFEFDDVVRVLLGVMPKSCQESKKNFFQEFGLIFRLSTKIHYSQLNGSLESAPAQ